MPFETNVFINCPFDSEYTKLLRPLVFTTLYLKLEPKLSQTKSSSHIRINQIKAHIKDSKFGIHDLSRCRTLKKKDLPRFNMPYELGLDIGCCEFGGKKLRSRRILILETERYHYQKVISDIAGQDIESHNNDPRTLVSKIRDWISATDDINFYPGAAEIWQAYNQFSDNLSQKLIQLKWTPMDIKQMTIGDFIKFTKDWVNTNRTV